MDCRKQICTCREISQQTNKKMIAFQGGIYYNVLHSEVVVLQCTSASVLSVHQIPYLMCVVNVLKKVRAHWNMATFDCYSCWFVTIRFPITVSTEILLWKAIVYHHWPANYPPQDSDPLFWCRVIAPLCQLCSTIRAIQLGDKLIDRRARIYTVATSLLGGSAISICMIQTVQSQLRTPLS